MESRIPLALSSTVGALMGIAIMVLGGPDTGEAPSAGAGLAMATTPVAAPSTAPAEPAAVAAETPPPASDGLAGLAQLPPPSEPADVGELTGGVDPFAALDNAQTLHGKNIPDMPDEVAGVPKDTKYYADIRGIGKLFRDHSVKVRVCMDTEGPAADPGEERVMLRVHVAPHPDDPEAGKLHSVDAPQDGENRYDAYLTCLMEAFADAEFKAPPGGETATTTWSVPR